jgi:hypothetical protein
MQLYRPILTSHCLRRLVLWALTMLAWFAAVFFAKRDIGPRQLRQRGDVSLEALARMAATLLIIRALHIIGRAPRRRIHAWRHGRDLRRAHFRRSLLGSKLRRALHHKDAATRITQLISVLRNLDAHAAHLARRIRSGLRRLWRIGPCIAAATDLPAAPRLQPALADSS